MEWSLGLLFRRIWRRMVQFFTKGLNFIRGVPQDNFSWVNERNQDVWTEIIKHLDAKSIAKLATTCNWFEHFLLKNSDPLVNDVWRDKTVDKLGNLQGGRLEGLQGIGEVGTGEVGHGVDWFLLHKMVRNPTNYFSFPDPKHQYWHIVGNFLVGSGDSVILLTKPITEIEETQVEYPPALDGHDLRTVHGDGFCIALGVRPGLWLVEYHHCHCPDCPLDSGCPGKLLILQARCVDCFSEKSFRDGSWTYRTVAQYYGPFQGAFMPLQYYPKEVENIFRLRAFPDDGFRHIFLKRSHASAGFVMFHNLNHGMVEYSILKTNQDETLAMRAGFYLPGLGH